MLWQSLEMFSERKKKELNKSCVRLLEVDIGTEQWFDSCCAAHTEWANRVPIEESSYPGDSGPITRGH
jgi:hypothetical protein